MKRRQRQFQWSARINWNSLDGQRDAETKSGKFCSIEYAFLREHIAVLMKIGFRYTLPASCSILSRSLHLDSQARLFRQRLAVKGDATSWKLPRWYLHRDTISTSFPFLSPLWLCICSSFMFLRWKARLEDSVSDYSRYLETNDSRKNSRKKNF